MIKETDLLPGTTAKYGIEYESIIMDKSKQDYICIYDGKLYDSILDEPVSGNIDNFMEDFEIYRLFMYQPSLECKKLKGGDKRLEFASHAYKPSDLKPSIMFENLGRVINAFSQWTDEKYYLPDHGTIAYFNEWNKKVMTTVTGGTHMTISFPLTIHDNPITWKYFMWLFTGLMTMYQPIYVALNGAPSPFTRGSERQRVSGSVVVGSAYIYDIFTTESERYEIFINSPSSDYDLPLYPNYAHWLSKDIDYKRGGLFMGSNKCDIGNSSYHRADVFKLREKEELASLIKEKFENRLQNIHSYFELIKYVGSMTSNLIEFRFFDNEPVEHLLEKFNLLIRIADYAYEQSKDMEESIGIEGIKQSLNTNIDNKLNIRLLVNKKPWHDAVVQSMKDGIDTVFSDEFIDECYYAFFLTDFSEELENEYLTKISAIELNKLFIKRMNTSTRYFSDYFQTDNPKPVYSKEYQTKKYKESVRKAEKIEEEYLTRKAEKERVLANINKNNRKEIMDVIVKNVSGLDRETKELIYDYLNFDKLSEELREDIHDGHGIDIYIRDSNIRGLIKESLSTDITTDIPFSVTKDDCNVMVNWFKESLVPMLEKEISLLKQRKEEREEQSRLEQERERQRLEQERYSERERQSRLQSETSIVKDIILTNINHVEDGLKNLIFETIDFKKISELLSELIFRDNVDVTYLRNSASRNLYVSTLADVLWNDVPQEKQNLLIEWFKESLVPDLARYVPIPSTSTTLIQTPQQMEDQSLQIIGIISRNVSNLTNTDMRDIINRTIYYHELADKLQRWVYISHYGTKDIIDNMDLLIHYSLKHSIDNEPETYELLKVWIESYLIDDLVNSTPIQETRGLGALFV